MFVFWKMFFGKCFLENVCLSTKFDLRLKKKQKNFSQVVIYGNYMTSIFSTKRFFSFQYDTSISIPKQGKGFLKINSMTPV